MTANQIIIQKFIGRLGLQQRVLPIYRKDFIEKLASVCDKGLSVFAGEPLSDEQIHTVNYLDIAEFVPANNWHIFRIESPLYQCWQFGLMDWLENCQPDVIIVEANPRYRSTPRALKWMHMRNRPVIGWGLGAPPINGFLASWRQRERERFLHSLDLQSAQLNLMLTPKCSLLVVCRNENGLIYYFKPVRNFRKFWHRKCGLLEMVRNAKTWYS